MADRANVVFEASPSSTPPASLRARMVGLVGARDQGFRAVKRSVRAAVTMPTVFGVTHLAFSNAQVGLFGAFGSFALLLLVDFPGRPRARLISYLTLVVVGSAFIALATVISTDKVAAVVVMALVGFGVLFSGLIAPQAAAASTAALLIFVLPVAVVQPAAAVGPRLLGWVFAAAFSIPACMFVWPTPWHDELRRRLASTLTAVAQLAAATMDQASVDESRNAVESELTRLRGQFAATPYPATAAAAGAVALAKLMGRVEWAASTATSIDISSGLDLTPIRLILESVAETLQRCAALICDGSGYPVDDPEVVQALQDATRRLAGLMDTEVDFEVSELLDLAKEGSAPAGEPGAAPLQGVAPAVDPGFHARAVAVATEMVANATLEAAGAETVGDWRLGPAEAPARALRRRLLSHLSFHSVWFRNAVRGGVGLGLAVAVVEITDVEHGFWVVLGTLSVLRSNALGTGATALRAVGGTAVGFVLGAVIMVGVADHTVALWVLLPLGVLVAGVVPTMISFAAGQAGFTLVVIILFNIIDPVGWRLGLTRVEDVAIGCGVSIVVGLLFWPRGATAALGRALSDAFVTSSGYLADAVDRLTTTLHEVDTDPGQRAAHSAYLRLDDAFRQFLIERGAKVIPVQSVANLYTGSNRIRLAAYTLSAVPTPSLEPGQTELESVALAAAVLRDAYASSHRWYEEFAEMLAGRRQSLDSPPAHHATLQSALHSAFEDARRQRRGDRLRSIFLMLWADELLESQQGVQNDLAGSAELFARRSRALTI
jgi:uncharacterized membrane protein YccC